MDCRSKNNSKLCPCTNTGCPRLGICCECIRYHCSQRELPACYFSKEAEATYDRSIEKFIEDNG